MRRREFLRATAAGGVVAALGAGTAATAPAATATTVDLAPPWHAELARLIAMADRGELPHEVRFELQPDGAETFTFDGDSVNAGLFFQPMQIAGITRTCTLAVAGEGPRDPADAARLIGHTNAAAFCGAGPGTLMFTGLDWLTDGPGAHTYGHRRFAYRPDAPWGHFRDVRTGRFEPLADLTGCRIYDRVDFALIP